jgi:SAM-dependent methyltransferase
VGLQRLLQSLPNVTYHSADLASPRAAERFDICAIPYPDDTFDVILCSHVLEHVPDDRKAMSELFRVMKRGGWGLIEAPMNRKRAQTFEDWSVTSEADRERVFGQRDHVRIYGKDYYARLRGVGFQVTPEYYAKSLPAEAVAKHALLMHSTICLCTKPAAA